MSAPLRKFLVLNVTTSHAGAADVHRVKARALHLTRDCCVRYSRQHHRTPRDQLTQLCGFASLCHVERKSCPERSRMGRGISCYFCGISNAFISSSTFTASSSFHARSTIFFARV